MHGNAIIHGGRPQGLAVTQSLSTCFKVFQRFGVKQFFLFFFGAGDSTGENYYSLNIGERKTTLY